MLSMREMSLFVNCSKLFCSKILQLNNLCRLHTSPMCWRRKKPFYNRHIKQIQNENVYTGFVNEFFERHIDRVEAASDDASEYDLEEAIQRESARRVRASKHSRLMRELTKGAGPRLLTCDQMDHVRFLNQESPDEWTPQSLAHSFQVPELVIRKVLRSRPIQNPEMREKIDSKARENQGLGRRQQLSPPVAQLKPTKELSLVPTNNAQNQQSWGLADLKNNGWFSDYSETKPSSSKGDRVVKKRDSSAVEWMEEDDEEFMFHLMNSYEETREDEESAWEGDALETDAGEDFQDELEFDEDGNVFYNDEFLYKA